MKPFGTWFGRLALAGGCLAWVGCGGGGVPDPDSDSHAATEVSARPVDQGGAQAPAAEPPAPEAVTPPEPVAAARPPAPAAEPEKTEPPAVATAEAEKAAPAVKGDASGTEEMLRIAATPAPTPPPGETAAATAQPGGPGAPGMPGGPGGYPGAAGGPPPGGYPGASGGPPPGMAGGPPGVPNAPVAPGYPGGPGGPGTPGGPEGFRPPGVAGIPGEPGGPTMAGGPMNRGGPGGPGEFTGIGGPGGMNGANGSTPVTAQTFLHPHTAVKAFLDALQAKNKDRLTQATARRAPTEADEKHRKIFAEIVDGSIADDDLDEMAKAMSGFQVSGVLPAKSTGRIGVIVSKMEGRGDRLQRTITVRKEADGWKVLDISSMIDFKAMPMFNRGGRRR